MYVLCDALLWHDLKTGTKKQFSNAFGNHSRALRFDDKPDYFHLRNNFRGLFICEDYLRLGHSRLPRPSGKEST
jgi:hypothetical protein